MDIGKNKCYQYVNMTKTRKNYLTIIADKDECMRVIPNTYTLGTSMHEKTSDCKRNNTPLSGKIILMITTLPSFNDNNRYDTVWEHLIYDKVKTYKPNVLASYDHFGSSGAF